MTDRRDERARRDQIAADLRAHIMAGDYAPGMQLPSTQQLISHYDASNTSVAGALAALKAEGYLTSRAGKGVYVRDHEPFVIRVGAYFVPTPHGYSYQILEVAQVTPPADVAAVLGDTAILRKRIMCHGGEPVELMWSYYPTQIATGTVLTEPHKIKGGAPAILADLGYPECYFTDRLSARAPTTEELETLGIPDDVPVMRQFRVVYSQGERPVEVSVGIKGAHRYELLYQETIGMP